MKKTFLLFVNFFLFVLYVSPQLKVQNLLTENFNNPVGIGVQQPEFSWQLTGNERNILQTAYEIKVNLNKKQAWASGKISSSQSVHVPYKGGLLQSGKKYTWQVRVWDSKGKASSWSEPATFQMGLLNKEDWKAKWIEPTQDTSSKKSVPPIMMRKEFSLNKKVATATLYATAHGLYNMRINDKLVTDAVFTPGWTSYVKRLQYQTYDVTSLVKTGANAIGSMIGEGWYNGQLAWASNRSLWGKVNGLLAQLHVTYTDGSEVVVITDGTWKYTNEGPVRSSEIYDGETYDARMEKNGWALAGYNDASWKPVGVAQFDMSNLTAQDGPMVKRIEELKAQKVFRTPEGTLVVDFGQNMTGWVKLKVKGPAGSKVVLRHAEVLDKAGNFYTANIRAAKQRIEYILKGSGEEVFEPHFTFQGFRYIAVDEFPGELTADNVSGIVVHSDMQPTGTLETSNALINQLQHNIQWGQKGNFLDVPTDCPQRDERLGWTGDAQAFVRTACFNMNVNSFFIKWLKDISADQLPNGGVPFVIPDALRDKGVSAGWGDVALIAPWTIYLSYGNKKILEDQYQSMKNYVEYIRKIAGDSCIWKNGSVFGDWLFYKPGLYSHTEPDGYTNGDLIATAFFAYSTTILKNTAAVLGKTADEADYAALLEKIKEAFNKEYVTEAGRLFSDSQTSYVLALMFDLLPDAKRKAAAGFLAKDISNRGHHLSTGFLGTPYLCHVLSRFGYTDVAYKLLLQETYPSWLYPVKMGATTIWERWNGIRTDSTFEDPGMNSFNHYAYGAIGEWMYRVAAGLEIDTRQPGYKHFFIQPQPGGNFSHMKAGLKTGYGNIVSGWELKNGKIIVTVKVPANTSATIRLPKSAGKLISESGKALQQKNSGSEDAVLEYGSGDYVFEYDY